MMQLQRLSSSGSGNQKNQGVMGQLLLLIVVHNLLPVQSMRDVMWNKETQKFELIANIPNFAFLYNYNSDNRVKQIYNFQGKDIRFAYYDMPNIITGKDNRTVTGYIGEIWNLLANYLNFTLKPILTKDRSVGWEMENGTVFSPGLLRMLQLNQTDVIARMEAGFNRRSIAQFTLPLQKSRLYIYIKSAPKHITTWILELFSKGVWLAILTTYILLSIFSYIFRTIEMEMQRQNKAMNMLDHFFYNFSTICNQSNDSGATSESSKMLEYLVFIFALLINASFNGLVINHMTQTVTVMPFNDFQSLVKDSQYTILTVKGSLVNLEYQGDYLPKYSCKKNKKTVLAVDNTSEVFKTLCSKKLMCAVIIEEERLANRHYMCHLQSVALSMKLDIVSGISLNFKDKRSIDFGLLKLYETGLIRAIHNSWLKQIKNNHTKQPEPIVLEQVYLVLSLLFVGMFISIMVLIFEQVTFHCTK